MTREDIDKYAAECAEANMITPIDYPFYNNDYNEHKEAYIKTFNQGVEYADSHPKSLWISVKDDLPCNHENLIYEELNNWRATELVLVNSSIGVHIDWMEYHNGKWEWQSEKRTKIRNAHWMPIPELPKE